MQRSENTEEREREREREQGGGGGRRREGLMKGIIITNREGGR